MKGEFLEKLKTLEKRDGRALVLLLGIFYGPEPVKIDPGLRQYMKEKLAGTKRRYGHLGSLETMIQGGRRQEGGKVSAGTPYSETQPG